MIYSLRPNTDYIFVSYVLRIHQLEARDKNKTKQNQNEILIEERKDLKAVCAFLVGKNTFHKLHRK